MFEPLASIVIALSYRTTCIDFSTKSSFFGQILFYLEFCLDG